MAICSRKRFPREKLCTGDLDKLLDIYERRVVPTLIGNSEPNIELSLVIQLWCAIETPRGTSYFNDVNTEEVPTHIFYILNNPELPNIETSNHFVLFDSRWFRILDVRNMDEDSYYQVIRTVETGEMTEAASEG